MLSLVRQVLKRSILLRPTMMLDSSGYFHRKSRPLKVPRAFSPQNWLNDINIATEDGQLKRPSGRKCTKNMWTNASGQEIQVSRLVEIPSKLDDACWQLRMTELLRGWVVSSRTRPSSLSSVQLDRGEWLRPVSGRWLSGALLSIGGQHRQCFALPLVSPGVVLQTGSVVTDGLFRI